MKRFEWKILRQNEITNKCKIKARKRIKYNTGEKIRKLGEHSGVNER